MPGKPYIKGFLKKEKFHCDFKVIFVGWILPQCAYSQFTMKLFSENKCTAFDLKFGQSGAFLVDSKMLTLSLEKLPRKF